MDSDRVILDSDEGFILSSDIIEVLGSTLRLDEGTYLGFLDGFFDGSNDVTLEGSWLEESLESYDGNYLGSFDGAEYGIFEGSTWESEGEALGSE